MIKLIIILFFMMKLFGMIQIIFLHEIVCIHYIITCNNSLYSKMTWHNSLSLLNKKNSIFYKPIMKF